MLVVAEMISPLPHFVHLCVYHRHSFPHQSFLVPVGSIKTHYCVLTRPQ